MTCLSRTPALNFYCKLCYVVGSLAGERNTRAVVFPRVSSSIDRGAAAMVVTVVVGSAVRRVQ